MGGAIRSNQCTHGVHLDTATLFQRADGAIHHIREVPDTTDRSEVDIQEAGVFGPVHDAVLFTVIYLPKKLLTLKQIRRLKHEPSPVAEGRPTIPRSGNLTSRRYLSA